MQSLEIIFKIYSTLVAEVYDETETEDEVVGEQNLNVYPADMIGIRRYSGIAINATSNSETTNGIMYKP
jgi:hypothetical protein